MKALRTVRLGLAMAVALVVGGAAMAQGPGGMGPGVGPGFGEHQPPMERAFGPGGDHGRWWNNPRIAARLQLTDAQRKTFDGILLAHREKLIDLRATLEKAELELEPMVSADQPDETRILAQIDKVAQARAELEKANARFLLAIRAQLTPEQWKQVREFHDRFKHQDRLWGPQGKGPQGWRNHPAPAPQQAPQGAQSQAPPAGAE